MTFDIPLRAGFVVAAVLGMHVYASSVAAGADAAANRRLAAVPMAIDEWQGADQPSFDAETLRILGADQYLNRVYVHPAGSVASLYVAFYGSQRSGESIHSPLHCLPGNGWRPLTTTRISMATDQGPLIVNRLLVEKASVRQLVLYWFEGRGRSVASEYKNKLLLVWDGVRHRRSDGALVRIITPVVPVDNAGQRAESAAVAFASQVFRPLREVLE